MRSPTPLWFLAGSLLLAAGLAAVSERDSGEHTIAALATLRADFHSYVRKTAPELDRLRAEVAQLQEDLDKEIGLTERTQDLYDCSTAEIERLNMERRNLKALLEHFERWRDGMGGDPRLPGRVRRANRAHLRRAWKRPLCGAHQDRQCAGGSVRG